MEESRAKYLSIKIWKQIPSGHNADCSIIIEWYTSSLDQSLRFRIRLQRYLGRYYLMSGLSMSGQGYLVRWQQKKWLLDYRNMIGRVKEVSSSDLAISPRKNVRLSPTIQEVSTLTLGTSRLVWLPTINWAYLGNTYRSTLKETNYQWRSRA